MVSNYQRQRLINRIHHDQDVRMTIHAMSTYPHRLIEARQDASVVHVVTVITFAMLGTAFNY